MLILVADVARDLVFAFRWSITDYTLDADTVISHRSGLYIGTGQELGDAAIALRYILIDNGQTHINTGVFHDINEDGAMIAEQHLIYTIQAYRIIGDYEQVRSYWAAGIPLGVLENGIDLDLANSLIAGQD